MINNNYYFNISICYLSYTSCYSILEEISQQISSCNCRRMFFVFMSFFILSTRINSCNNNAMSIKNQLEQYVFHGQFSIALIAQIQRNVLSLSLHQNTTTILAALFYNCGYFGQKQKCPNIVYYSFCRIPDIYVLGLKS